MQCFYLEVEEAEAFKTKRFNMELQFLRIFSTRVLRVYDNLVHNSTCIIILILHAIARVNGMSDLVILGWVASQHLCLLMSTTLLVNICCFIYQKEAYYNTYHLSYLLH